MVISLVKANEIKKEIDTLRLVEKDHIGLIDFDNICRKHGVLERYQRKEIMLYLEALNILKLGDTGVIKLTPIGDITDPAV